MRHSHAAATALLFLACRVQVDIPADAKLTCLSDDNKCLSPSEILDRKPCTADADCDDGVFCNGPETCDGHFCRAGAPPCVAPFACVSSTCLEAARQCDIRVDHGKCAPIDVGGSQQPTYCNPVAGIRDASGLPETAGLDDT